MNKEFEALEAALNALADGGSGEPSAAGSMAAPLHPLLRTARAVSQLAGDRPSALTSIRIRTALRAAGNQPPAGARHAGRRSAWAIALAMMLFLLLGMTSAYASGEALPDSPFYPVRGLGERLQVSVADSPTRRATLYVDFASRRSQQLGELAHQHRSISTDGLAVLLRDIRDLMQHGNRDARGGGPAARAAVREAEVVVVQQLKQTERDGNFSASQNDSLDETIRGVEADESTSDD